MSIFVTGGAGFIGSHFIREWIARYPTQQLVNFDKLTYAGNLENLADVAGNPAYTMFKGDICNLDEVLRALPEECDAIVHFAAESHVDRSITSAAEFVSTNVEGTQTLLEAARARRVRRFLHISTDEVGGSMQPGQWFAESAPLAPSSPYAASKAAAEHFVRAAAHTFGQDVVITRTSNNYGPYQFPEKLIPLAITNGLLSQPIPVYGDGLQERDWIHVVDNTNALMMVLQSGRSGETYHIGGRNPRTNLALLGRLLDILGQPASLLQPLADRLGHDRRYAVDCSKLETELGWRPQIDFEDGLRETIHFYQSNPGWVSRARSGEYATYYERIYGTAILS